MENQTIAPPPDDMTEVLANIRHELRTPLNHIVGYSELLIDQAEEEGRADFAADLNKIRDAGRRVLSLLNILLTADGLATQLYTPPGSDDTGAPKSAIQGLLDGETAAIPAIVDIPEPQPRPAPALPGLPLLVVDDDANNRELMGRLLRQMGHKVIEAETGQAAIAHLAVSPCGAVFLDVVMPGMDGYQVLKVIQADPVLSNTPVIMVSAFDELQIVARCIEAGAEDYLPKPFNQTILRARLTATLEKKRLRDQEHELYSQLSEAHRRLQGMERLRGNMMQNLIGDLRDALDTIRTS